MVNNSHQYQHSEHTYLNNDGQQFTSISTKRIITSKEWWSTIPLLSTKQTITSKQWWSTIQTNINKANNHLETVMVNNSHQYQQNKESPLNSDGQSFLEYQQSKQTPLNSDGQQFILISTKRTNISKQWWSLIHTNINKPNNHL